MAAILHQKAEFNKSLKNLRKNWGQTKRLLLNNYNFCFFFVVYYVLKLITGFLISEYLGTL